jgi:putative ABC transport system substrate-binding protein
MTVSSEQSAVSSKHPGNKRVARRVVVFICLLLAVFLPAVSAEAQPGKVYRIGRLYGGVSGNSFGFEALRRELRELGYIEGKNIVVESRSAEEKPERLARLAEELVRLKVDVIVAGGPTDGAAAKKATQTIPVVFMDSPRDPVSLGLVATLARPGGNVTGFYSMADVLAGKRLELLKDALPKLSRVAVLRYAGSGSDELQWTESQAIARQLGLQLHSVAFGRTDDPEIAFKEAIKTGSTALAVVRHRVTQSSVNQKRIVELAAKYRLPVIYYREDFAEMGGLMSYGADELEPFKRIAAMVDKILKGAKTADIPVEQPTKFELVINLRTAKQIGLTFPPGVLARADKVIK